MDTYKVAIAERDSGKEILTLHLWAENPEGAIKLVEGLARRLTDVRGAAMTIKAVRS